MTSNTLPEYLRGLREPWCVSDLDRFKPALASLPYQSETVQAALDALGRYCRAWVACAEAAQPQMSEELARGWSLIAM